MSTFLRKTAGIFASDLDLGFMTWQNVLKDFRIELSSPGMAGMLRTPEAEALCWHPRQDGCGLLGAPAPRPFNFASTKCLSICEFLLALFLSHEISVSLTGAKWPPANLLAFLWGHFQHELTHGAPAALHRQCRSAFFSSAPPDQTFVFPLSQLTNVCGASTMSD